MQRSVNQIIDLLERRQKRVFAWLADPNRIEGIGEYLHILDHAKPDTIDEEFKRTYRHYYRLRFFDKNASVRRGMDTYYFNLLRRRVETGTIDFPDTLHRLHERFGRYELSFASKLLHTVDKNLPLYDENVRKVVGWSRTHGRGADEILARYEELNSVIHCLLLDSSVKTYIRKLRREFVQSGIPKTNVAKISDTKMLDFALWALGALI